MDDDQRVLALREVELVHVEVADLVESADGIIQVVVARPIDVGQQCLVGEEPESDGRCGVLRRGHDHEILRRGELKRDQDRAIAGIVSGYIGDETKTRPAGEPPLRLKDDIVGSLDRCIVLLQIDPAPQ